MRAVSNRNFTSASLLGGTLLLLCALVFYYFAVLKIDYRKTALLDLGPYPDAVEYFAQAKAMLKDGWPSVQIAYDKLPASYPFGYPALMLPWLKILPEADSVLAPFRTNQTVGLLFLLAVFGFYTYLAMPLTGGFAALLLATLPGFFTYCRSSMSEISASALIVLSFMFAYLGLKEERRWKIYLSAVFLGLSLNIRIQSLFFGPLLLAMACFRLNGSRLRWLLHCAALPVIFMLAASPMLLMNTIQFHSPLKTGYDFWVPYWTENHLLFSIRYIPKNAAALWGEFALLPKRFYVANIFGTGTSFVAAFVVLICVGLPFIRLNRFGICAVLAGSSFLAATLCQKFATEIRLYLPLLVLLVGVGTVPVTWAAKNLLVEKRTTAALAIFILFAAACLGYPSQSGYPAKPGRWQAWDALHFTTPPRRSNRFVAQKYFTDRLGGEPGIVLSDIDPVYLNALLPDSFVAAPIDGNHNYRFSKIWRYDRPQAMALAKRGLHQALPVYALFVSKEEMEAKAGRLPQIDGYEWVLVEDPTAKAAILKLCPRRE
jgi:4-amino-4-deoxy-L-arabinose transferase-like glycosyltransferase